MKKVTTTFADNQGNVPSCKRRNKDCSELRLGETVIMEPDLEAELNIEPSFEPVFECDFASEPEPVPEPKLEIEP
jgi:hypothetical protein